MWNSEDRVVSRRAVLGGTVIGVMGAGLGPAWAAQAGDNTSRRPVDEDSIDAVASTLDADLVELRRDIHRNPELAGQEQRTAALVAQQLQAAGLAVTTGVGGTGVVGVLTGAHHGRTVAFRADMDAVPPNAQFGGGPQPAHVCGHDIHTTVGVGVAQVLARLRHRLSGNVVFVFQPGEEALTGAAAMLADGVLTQTRPAEIHALHCGPFPVGQFLVSPGFGLPGQDRGVISLTGADAMVRAQQLATQISALSTVPLPLTTAAREQLVADLLTPNGPLATFVTIQAQPAPAVQPAQPAPAVQPAQPAQAVQAAQPAPAVQPAQPAQAVQAEGRADVRVSYRCWPEQRYLSVRQDIQQLAQSIGGATVSFPNDPFPALVCPVRDGNALKRYLRRTRGHDAVQNLYAAIPFNGEDFALFLNRIPGTFTFLGVRAPGTTIEESYPHFGAFNPDERAIGHGVRAMAGWLAQRARG